MRGSGHGDTLSGFAVCLGIERQNISGGHPPMDIHGLGVEQPEVGDEVCSIIRRKRVTAGRLREGDFRMTPNQVKTFATSIDMSRTNEVSARLEEFDTLVGNWLVESGNSISVCSVEHRQSIASEQWLMLTVMVTFWAPVAEQGGEEEARS